MRANLLPVAQEGWRYIAYAFSFFIFFAIFDFDLLTFFSSLLLIALIYSFRNPERQLPMFEKLSVVAPSDGVVKAIVELDDAAFAYRVEIESSSLDVGVLRAPLNATVESVRKFNGTRVSKSSKLFNDTNENVELVFVDENDNKLKVTHTLKQSFSPLFIDIIESQSIHQTARYGLMLNGVTSIYLPHNFRLNVNVSNELKASESLIGYFS